MTYPVEAPRPNSYAEPVYALAKLRSAFCTIEDLLATRD